MRQSIWASLAAIVALALVGCYQLEQKTTLMPDGSGKLEFTVGIKLGAGEDPFEQAGDPDEIEKNVKGIVAWTLPSFEEKNGWKRMRLTAYFEDINKVAILNEEMGGEAAGGVMLAFELKKDSSGSVLVVKDRLTDELSKLVGGGGGAEEDESADQMRAMMKAMFKEMKLSVVFSVPGKVAEAKGFTSSDGRVAKLDIGEQLLIDAMDGKAEARTRIDALRKEKQIRWGPGEEVGAAAVAEFEKELAAAKANWPKIRAEMKKQFDERKKNGPEDEDGDGKSEQPFRGRDR